MPLCPLQNGRAKASCKLDLPIMWNRIVPSCPPWDAWMRNAIIVQRIVLLVLKKKTTQYWLEWFLRLKKCVINFFFQISCVAKSCGIFKEVNL